MVPTENATNLMDGKKKSNETELQEFNRTRTLIEFNAGQRFSAMPCMRREKLNQLVITGMIERKYSREKKERKDFGWNKWLNVHTH